MSDLALGVLITLGVGAAIVFVLAVGVVLYLLRHPTFLH